jgi:hypothetical protein
MSCVVRLLSALLLALAFLGVALAGLTGPAQATVMPAMDLAPAGVPAEVILTTDFTATGRSLTRAGDAIYLFNDFSGSLNWRFGTKTSQWYNVAVVGSPPRRYGYGAAAYNNDIYVVGGETPGGSKLDDVWRYDPATGTWSEVPQDTRPPGRSGHSIVGTTDSLLIYGGTMATPTQETYLWKFDPATGYWSVVFGFENSQGTRWGHSAGILGDRWYAVGGVVTAPTHFVQRTTWNFSQFESVPATSTVQPSLRKNLAAVFDTQTTAIVIVGGEAITKNETFTDTWRFDVGSGTWTRLPDLPQPLDNIRAEGWHSPTTPSAVNAAGVFTDGLHILIVGDPVDGGETVSYVFDGDIYQLKSLPAAPDYDIFLPLILRQSGG